MIFSIVVPIYNVEKYLCDCIDSILGQIFKDFELILVNDGSTDDSENICNRYAGIDTRIKVIDKENGGASSARNAGIRIAQGEYIVFVDSDDYIQSEEFLFEMSKLLENAETDIIIYGHTYMHDVSKKILGKRYTDLEEINHKKKNEKLDWLIKEDKFSIAPWMHAINREFLIKNNLYFNEEYRTEEDIEWAYRVFASKPELYGFNNCDYVYRIRENSICHSARKSYFWKNRYNAIMANIELLNQYDLQQAEKKSLFGYLAFLYYVLLGELWDEPDKGVRKEALKKASEMRFLIKYGVGKRSRKCKLLISVCGLYGGSYFLNKYIHRKHS